MHAVKDGRCWDELWHFMVVFFTNIASILERSRRWGLKCSCRACQQMQDEGKIPRCIWASRRMRDAAGHTTAVYKELYRRGAAGFVQFDDCVRDLDLHAAVSLAARKAGHSMQKKFHFLWCPPWSFSRADTPDGAKSYLGILEAIADDSLHPLASHHRMFTTDLRTVIAGGEVSQRLEAEVDAMTKIPFNEGPGEGYHRASNLQRKRAAASSDAYILASTRLDQNIECIRKWAQAGSNGKKVVRYEWRNFKRIWQTKPSRAWVQAKMNNITFFNHLYRLHPPLPNLQSVIGVYRRTRSGSSSAAHHRSLPTTNY